MSASIVSSERDTCPHCKGEMTVPDPFGRVGREDRLPCPTCRDVVAPQHGIYEVWVKLVEPNGRHHHWHIDGGLTQAEAVNLASRTARRLISQQGRSRLRLIADRLFRRCESPIAGAPKDWQPVEVLAAPATVRIDQTPSKGGGSLIERIQLPRRRDRDWSKHRRAI